MPTIKIPTPLRPYTAGKNEIDIQAATVGEALNTLLALYPELREHFYKEDGQLSRFANIFVGKKHIRSNAELATPIGEDETLRIVPSIAGGKA